MKKRLSVLLASAFAAVLALVMAVPAYAAGENFTLTVNSKTPGHTFEAYQVFKGTLSTDGAVLSDIEWGTGVDGAAILDDLISDETIGDDFKAGMYAADVADVLKGYENNGAKLDAFAAIAGAHVKSEAKHTSTGGAFDDEIDRYVYTISGLDAGYYLVQDASNSPSDSAHAKTKFILEVVGSVTAEAKADQPPVDKVIDGQHDTDPVTDDDATYNNASIGDKVPYIITSSVPHMDGYNRYWFVVSDTLSKGLTYNEDLSVQIGSTDLEEGTDYTVTATKNQDGTTSLKIVFKDFLTKWGASAEQDIVIKYSATVNEDAVIGTGGNSNDVKLIFSNNPNVDYDGDEPGEDNDKPVGETPESTTYTYVTGVTLLKVDDGKPANALTGAQFEISGTRINKVLVQQGVYKLDASGAYWKLKDGSYTTTNPTEQTKDLYESLTDKYVLTTETSVVDAHEQVKATGWVDENGKLVFEGLGAGVYEIEELVAPNGYNILEDPIELTINWAAPSNPETSDCTWSATAADNAAVASYDEASGTIKLTVENRSGSLLPSTGGMGTTMFYVVGGVLVAGAAVAYVVKRRMDANNA